MKRKTKISNLQKTVINLEILSLGILGLVVASLYFSWDYKDFMAFSEQTHFFWIGVLVLIAIIISATLILISSFILFIMFIQWRDSKNERKGVK